MLINYYLPGYKTGGPVRSISNLVEWLGDEIEFLILTADHDAGMSDPYPNIRSGVWNQVGKAKVRYLTREELKVSRFSQIINAIKFDLFYIDSLLASTSIRALILRRFAMLLDKPIILSPRGHLGAGALRQKWVKKYSFLIVARFLRLYARLNWHATSEQEKREIIHNFGQETAHRISVAPNLPIPGAQHITETRPSKRSNSLRIVFLSRISRKKNLHFAIESMQGLKGRIDFDIYGPLEDEDYWKECQESIKKLPVNVNVQYRGTVSFDHVTNVLSQYHLFYLPTLHENYGHVIFEALSAGCPVLISDQTPWKDLEIYGAGWAVPLADIENFKSIIDVLVSMSEDDFEAVSARVLEYVQLYLGSSPILEQTRAMFSNAAANLTFIFGFLPVL